MDLWFIFKRAPALEDKKLRRYVQGKASRQEMEEVWDWLERPGSREELDKIIERYLEKPDQQRADRTDYKKLLDNIHIKIHQSPKKPDKNKRNLSISPLLKIAASAAFFGLCVYYITVGFRTVTPEATVKTEEVAAITKETAPGEKLTLTLPDRTKIVLNARSKVSFSSDYGKSERVVSLEGEAYFEIAPDNRKPFRLETKQFTTTALGTAFNAFSRKDLIKIALTEGRVSIASPSDKVELSPGEMVLALDSTMTEGLDMQVRPFDSAKVLAWKEGRIAFDRKPLKDILKDLEDWYGVRMDVQKGVELNRQVIGEFNNRSLEDILIGLGFSMGLEHKIAGDHVTIKPSS